MEIASSTSFKNLPIENPRKIDIFLEFTNDQFEKISRGFIPIDMDDRWFIFFENEFLHIHRSWTGFGLYKAKVEKESTRYCIRGFWVERNNEKYTNQDDNHDVKLFSSLVAGLLLGVEISEITRGETVPYQSTNKEWNYIDKIKPVLFGVAVGDALGVPVEFMSREMISRKPVKDMIGYGTYNLPLGTFSDDSSLTFCLAEALTEEFDLNKVAHNFVQWAYNNYWTARGSVFDIGIATRDAIFRLKNGKIPELAGGLDVASNGNGSLMRIAPLLFYIWDMSIEERYEWTKKVSSLTHGHVRSCIACFYYLEFARKLLTQTDKFAIYSELQSEITQFLASISINPSEIFVFDRLLIQNIYDFSEDQIFSSGYVIHTLEASIWCIMTTNTYRDAVLKAVNLGDDSDTTAAVTGGLAGLLYGYENIPQKWIKQLARTEDINELAQRMANFLSDCRPR